MVLVLAENTTWPYKGTAAYGHQEIEGFTLSILQEGCSSHFGSSRFGSHLLLFVGEKEFFYLWTQGQKTQWVVLFKEQLMQSYGEGNLNEGLRIIFVK